MLVVIESTVGGNVAGFLQCNVSGNETLGTLIDNYCESKGISIGPNFVLRDQKGILLDSKKTILGCHIKHGDTLYLENQGWKSEIFHFTNWWLLACMAILISVVGFSVAISLHLLSGPTPVQYGIVLDGGSSHTGLFVYEWPGPKWNGTGVLRQIGLCNSPGDISALYMNVSAVDTFLSPCLSYASNLIPSTSHHVTPIYFAATAGMRLLNISNPNGAIVLLEAIRNRLSRSGFKFHESQVQILSGSEEAEYSWVSVNFLTNKVGPHSLEGNRETLGAMDLGGASTQMSFESTVRKSFSRHSSGPAREHGIKNVGLFGANYSVYSESMLCYGVREIIKRYESMLVIDSGSAPGTIQSPCHPIGHSELVPAAHIFESPCALKQQGSSSEWTFNGTSDYKQCANMLDRLFNITYCQSNFMNDTCFFNENHPVDYEQTFMAFSSFTIVTNAVNSTKNSTLEDFQRSVRYVCGLTLEQVTNLGLNATLSPFFCLESQYVLSLLTTGYGFDDKSWQKLVFSNHVSDTELGWSMGFMMNKSNSIPATVSSVFLNTPAFISLTILFGFFLTVGCLLSYHAIRMKRSAHSYSRTIVLRMDDELERFLPVKNVQDKT